MSEKVKPCRCGDMPALDTKGSCIDLQCACGIHLSRQKCDLLNLAERETWRDDKCAYSPEAERVALKQVIATWNHRPREQELEAEIERLKAQNAYKAGIGESKCVQYLSEQISQLEAEIEAHKANAYDSTIAHANLKGNYEQAKAAITELCGALREACGLVRTGVAGEWTLCNYRNLEVCENVLNKHERSDEW